MTAGGKTVLVVEDTEDHRTLTTWFLRMGGYEAVCVTDGADALDYLRTHPAPDVILLDLRMPRMNGWEFLAAQERDPALAAIPVVIYSCEHHFRSERGLTPNVVCCICKTDSRDVFFNALRRAMAASSAHH